MKFLNWKKKKDKTSNNKSVSGEKTVVDVTPRAENQLYKGSKQLYSESIEENLRCLFQRLPDPNLVTEEFILGSRSQTKVVIAYLKDIANPGIVDEVKDRLNKIRAEIIPDTSYIERNIQDSVWSPFPQAELVAKVDLTLVALSQGRIAIFVDYCPEIIIVPTTFFDILDTPEDAYRRWFVASSFFRIARFICFFIAALLPGFYIALTSFHPELIPTVLAVILTSTREGTPFRLLRGLYPHGYSRISTNGYSAHAQYYRPCHFYFLRVTLVLTGILGNIISGPILIVVGLTIIASFTIPGLDLLLYPDNSIFHHGYGYCFGLLA